MTVESVTSHRVFLWSSTLIDGSALQAWRSPRFCPDTRQSPWNRCRPQAVWQRSQIRDCSHCRASEKECQHPPKPASDVWEAAGQKSARKSLGKVFLMSKLQILAPLRLKYFLLSPGQVARLLRASSGCTKFVGLISGQGTHQNQPRMHKYMG